MPIIGIMRCYFKQLCAGEEINDHRLRECLLENQDSGDAINFGNKSKIPRFKKSVFFVLCSF
jgi:hypothetical protein